MLKIIPGLPHWPACFFCMSVCWGSISWVSVAGVKTTRGFYVPGWLKVLAVFRVCCMLYVGHCWATWHSPVVPTLFSAAMAQRDLSQVCLPLSEGVITVRWVLLFSMSVLSLENTPHSFPSSPLDSLHWIGSVNLSHFKGFLSTCQFSN